MSSDGEQKIRNWAFKFDKNDFKVKSKIGDNFYTKEDAVKAAEESDKQVAIIEENGKFIAYEIDDSIYLDDHYIEEFDTARNDGKASSIINFLGKDEEPVKPLTKEELNWAEEFYGKINNNYIPSQEEINKYLDYSERLEKTKNNDE